MGPNQYPQLIGTSVAISSLREEVERVARCDAKVLISGESGAGKEVVARAIAMHPEGVRGAAFVPVNCAGTSEALLEAELFGQVAAAPQVTDHEVRGKLEMADQGTIFLDEIGELSLRLQGRLLRFLETGEVQRVGAQRMTSPSNVRIVSATNRDPWDLVARGQMREDFFYRINVIHLVVPPLRERREDIPLLVDHFLKRFTTNGLSATGNGNAHDGVHANGQGPRSPIRAFAPEAMAALCEYSWPGNVRQVENVVERLAVTGRSELVQLQALPGEIRQQVSRGPQASRERDHTVADNLFRKLVDDRESFWTAVYPLYMQREITRNQVPRSGAQGFGRGAGQLPHRPSSLQHGDG